MPEFRMAFAFIAMLFLFLAVVQLHAQNTNVRSANLTNTINSTSSFLNTVNRSSYLVFYPDMSQAYDYLYLAENQSNESYSYALLAKARYSAKSQLDRINSYREISLYVLIASAAVLACLLYWFMRLPPAKTARKRKIVRHLSK